MRRFQSTCTVACCSCVVVSNDEYSGDVWLVGFRFVFEGETVSHWAILYESPCSKSLEC